MSEFERYESEDAVGLQIDIPIEGREGVTATAVMIAAYDNDTVATPYMYLNARDGEGEYAYLSTDEKEQVYDTLLKAVQESDSPLVTKELKEFADNTLQAVGELEQLVETEGEYFEYHGMSVTAYSEDYSKPVSRDNIGFYEADGAAQFGENDIYKLASKFAVLDEEIRCQEISKEHLQEFYEEKILPLRDVDYADMTEEQKDDMGTFSDWHKDEYGYRPRDDDRNVCHAAYERKQEAENEKKHCIERE